MPTQIRNCARVPSGLATYALGAQIAERDTYAPLSSRALWSSSSSPHTPTAPQTSCRLPSSAERARSRSPAQPAARSRALSGRRRRVAQYPGLTHTTMGARAVGVRRACSSRVNRVLRTAWYMTGYPASEHYAARGTHAWSQSSAVVRGLRLGSIKMCT